MVFSVEARPHQMGKKIKLGGIGKGENVQAMKPRCVGEEAER